MSAKYHGGAAFPCEWRDQQGINQYATGMTLRDYFAAKAMALRWSSNSKSVEMELELLAQGCYMLADAMLKARSE